MAASKKSRIKNDIIAKMEQKGLTSPLYKAQLDQYMIWYTQLTDLNRLAASTDNQKIKLDCMKEARQLQKSMQGILDWMGIDPNAEEAQEDNFEL